VPAFQRREHRLTTVRLQDGDGDIGRVSGFAAVAYPVDRRHQGAVAKRLDHVAIAADGLAWPRERRDTPLDHRSGRHCLHFVAVTVVPIPMSETMSNSSISRLTPARPSPRPPDVE